MEDHRSSGILLAVSSLPGPYGIGSLGGPARRFVDFLAEAGQHYWQILPLVPPGDGSSPYMSPSAFAGNPYLIDLDELAAEGLLTPQELDGARWPDPDRVDYDHLAQTRIPLLRKAWERSQTAHLQSDAPDLPCWRITAPSPPSTTGIKPLSGSGLRTPLRRSRRRLIFTVSSRRPSTASGWL